MACVSSRVEARRNILGLKGTMRILRPCVNREENRKNRKKKLKKQKKKHKNSGKTLTKSIMRTIIIYMMRAERNYSAKRDAILKALRSTTTHPGARWVYESLKPAIPGLSLGTVYRNLGLFRQEGQALSLGTVRGEERFDGVTEPHPHCICSLCGAVLDLPPDEAAALVRNCEDAPKTAGFSIDFRQTVFYGLCERCVSNDESYAAAQAASK